MPAILVWGAAGVFILLGLREAEKASDALNRLVWSGAAAGGVYLAGRKMGAW